MMANDLRITNKKYNPIVRTKINGFLSSFYSSNDIADHSANQYEGAI